MNDFTLFLVLVIIFFPDSAIYDKNKVCRFKCTGVLYGIVRFFYWIMSEEE